ncbi:hypothetical protein DM860_015962 [Cuscuta australis]|uniref:HP domain-containing protein n=1 Tax=Cuscuta australis TaxID=267555 RepID=A0A328DYM0_9ASTE|nr:hypothetical protein DM860_015962 [Cuscuta australis]
MVVSSRNLDSAFQSAGQKTGIEIWYIENCRPVPIPEASYGKFYTRNSYIILKTTSLKSGTLRHDIHYWLGKDTGVDEAGAAAIKTVELDAVLGGHAVQYHEVQSHETEKFLSYFKPCIIPQEGVVASGSKPPHVEEHKTRLYVCKGKHVVHIKEVPFARSSLNHDDILILDTKSKIFQFNGANSSIQERAYALEVVRYIKDTYHNGKCEVAAIDDGKLMADADTGEFWGLFGGFAPLPRKTTKNDTGNADSLIRRLYRINGKKPELVEANNLTRDILDTNRCYILDCGIKAFVWMGRNTSLDERKSASVAADELIRGLDRSQCHVVCMNEGFETVTFRKKFDAWPQPNNVAVVEDGKGKVAALLKRQGVNMKGFVKDSPRKEEPQPHIDCTGDLQVWHANGDKKTLLPASNQSKFYSGDCFIFQYSYPGEDKEEHNIIGTWFGKHSVEEDQLSATSNASKMVESMKFCVTQARIHEGFEPIQFLSIFQTLIVFKGGHSEGYKKFLAEKELPDDTYREDGIALFRVQGTGPDNMQAIQVVPVASSLNSSYCYILHSGSTLFTWYGNLTTSDDQDLAERQLDLIKPEVQSRLQKEGAESEQFWDILGGKSEYSNLKVERYYESDPHLFSCIFSNGDLKVIEIYNFNQDDLLTEDIFIIDCLSDIYVWVGQLVESNTKMQALAIGEKFIQNDFLLEKLSEHAPIYIVFEGSEPTFFTRFFNWDSLKAAMHGNSFQRKLAIVKNGGTPVVDKPKRRTSYSGRSIASEKSQRSRSLSSSPDRVRARGRSPAFNALAANFENPSTRNLSTPPPMVRKIFPKSGTPDSTKLPSRSAAIAALTATFDKTPSPARSSIPSFTKGRASPEETPKPETIKEDVKEGDAEDDDGLPTYPYDRLKTSSTNPITDEIDITKREAYLSSQEFREKFGMTKDAFYKLPKWKQNKLKMTTQLF